MKTTVEVDLNVIRKLSKVEIVFYIFIKNYCDNNDGKCLLTNEEISNFIGNETKNNNRTLASLVNKGFIKRTFEEPWNQRVIRVAQ
jgi:DNA-binding MarR family transcriptional regulator